MSALVESAPLVVAMTALISWALAFGMGYLAGKMEAVDA